MATKNVEMTYEELLAECRKLKQHHDKMKELVPKMYDILIHEGKSPKDAGDRIKKDLTDDGWNEDYIRSLLLPEAKNETKSRAGKLGAKKSRHETMTIRIAKIEEQTKDFIKKMTEDISKHGYYDTVLKDELEDIPIRIEKNGSVIRMADFPSGK